MGYKGITALKFVGTVSLGLLTGLSFSLSTVTVPTLLTLPSARSAGNAFKSLADAASVQLRSLSGIATSAFLLAYTFSPRAVRHPYLLYTSLLVLGGRLVTSDRLAPYLFASTTPSAKDGAGSSSATATTVTPAHVHNIASVHPMEASYEVLGAHTAGSVSGSASDSHSDGAGSDIEVLHASTTTASGPDVPTPTNSSYGSTIVSPASSVNGEEVRAVVEVFLKKQIVRTAISGLAFAIAVIGLWGDGSRPDTI